MLIVILIDYILDFLQLFFTNREPFIIGLFLDLSAKRFLYKPPCITRATAFVVLRNQGILRHATGPVAMQKTGYFLYITAQIPCFL